MPFCLLKWSTTPGDGCTLTTTLDALMKLLPRKKNFIRNQLPPMNDNLINNNILFKNPIQCFKYTSQSENQKVVIWS